MVVLRIYLFIIASIIVSCLLSINSIAGTPISNKNTIEWSHLISKRGVQNENRETTKADFRKNNINDGISDDEDEFNEDPDDTIEWRLLSAANADDLNEALRNRRKRAISAYTNLASSQMARIVNRKKHHRQPIYRPFQSAGQPTYKSKHWRSKRELMINDEDNDDGTDNVNDLDNEPLSDQELQQLAQLIYEMQLLNNKGSADDGSYPDELDHYPWYINPSGSPVRLRMHSGSRKRKRSLEPSYYGYRTSPERPLPRDVVWLRPAPNVDGGRTEGGSEPLGEIGTVVGPYDASILANSPYAYEPAFYGASTLRDATEAANRRRLGEMELEKRIVSLARYLNNRALRKRRRR